MKKLLIKIDKSEQFTLQLIVMGMHLLEKYGNTYTEIDKDFDNYSKVYMDLQNDNPDDLSNASASEIIQLNKLFLEL